MREKKPKSEIEDEDSNPTDEDSIKNVKKKGIKSNCSYCIKGFHLDNIFLKKNMGIMYYLIEKHNIEVLDELEKPADSLEQCHTAQFQGDITYVLSARVILFSHVSDIYLFSDISESEISEPFFDDPPLSLLDSSPKNCDFSLDIDLSLRSYSSKDCIYDLE